MRGSTTHGEPALVVIAKECRPGAVKTRLIPALGAAGAAEVARACLLDTLDAVDALAQRWPSGAGRLRRVLFLQGDPEPTADLAGWEVLAQPAGGLDERIGHLLDVVTGPLALVGMDTPQLEPDDLAPALGLLLGDGGGDAAGADGADGTDGADAWFGPAADGGFWSLAVGALPGRSGQSGQPGSGRRGDLVRGVPMSQDDTGAHQLARLRSAGLRVRLLGELRDVDTADDLAAVARLAPATRAAQQWRALSRAAG